MFFLIPINTDAPIYHWPWVTVTLMVANVIAFVATGGGYEPFHEQWDPWMLHYGQGLHPLEWVACNFLHFGIFHLVGNMIFLWGFGIVVEGKIGWWPYLLVYFGVGISRAFLEQVMMLGYNTASEFAVHGSGGASGVIFGLLAISLVWAPKNEMTLFMFLWVFLYIRFTTFEVTILAFSIYYIGLQALLALFSGFAMSSEMIHLTGAVLGFGVGMMMLKLDWVDCENWDLIAVMKGTYGGSAFDDYHVPVTTRVKSTKRKTWRERLSLEFNPDPDLDGLESRKVNKTKAITSMREYLEQGKPLAAYAEFQKLKHLQPDYQLEEPDLRTMADGLYRMKSWTDALPLMEEYLARFPDRSPVLRLKLAALLVDVESRPRYALKILKTIRPESLSERLTAHRKRIERLAKRKIDEGIIEFEEDVPG